MSPAGADAARSRPYQNWIAAEQCHWPFLFPQMPSVYCRSPLPNGVSGHRFGPSRRSKSTSMYPVEKSTLVIFAVSAQLPRSFGLSSIMALVMSNGTYLKLPVDEYGPTTPVDGSLTCTRQKYVALVVRVAVIDAEV